MKQRFRAAIINTLARGAAFPAAAASFFDNVRSIKTKTVALPLAAALLASAAGAANAASIGLSTNYSLESVVQIGGTREAGAVTYDWDHNGLFVLGDETDFEFYSIVNGAVSPATIQYANQISTFTDPEGVAYLGGNQFVVAQERRMELNKLNVPPTVFTKESEAPTFCIVNCAHVGNEGLEGISYDRRTGDFYAVKETNSQMVWKLTDVDFAGNGAVEQLFDASLLGLLALSDISVLSNSDAFFGTAVDDNLLILSARSKMLLEVTKTGEILSSFDLSSTGFSAIEGVTVDNDGNIWLAAEFVGFDPRSGTPSSGLIKLRRDVVTAVPEPATWAMMIGGFGVVGGMMRRRNAQNPASFA